MSAEDLALTPLAVATPALSSRHQEPHSTPSFVTRIQTHVRQERGQEVTQHHVRPGVMTERLGVMIASGVMSGV